MHSPGGDPILLVEDNDDDVFLFRRALTASRLSHQLHVAHDGRAAIAFLSEASVTPGRMPSVVFLDLKLPHLSGFEVLEWIATQPALRDLRVVVLSGCDRRTDAGRAIGLGAHACDLKPLSAANLRKYVESAGSPDSLPVAPHPVFIRHA